MLFKLFFVAKPVINFFFALRRLFQAMLYNYTWRFLPFFVLLLFKIYKLLGKEALECKNKGKYSDWIRWHGKLWDFNVDGSSSYSKYNQLL